tara:strand:- start:2580 stop:3530 length:951 start_codon:yes stop_codon:yes gene_type:complete
MKFKKLSLLILGAVITLSGCKKIETNTQTLSQPDAAQLINFFADNNTAAKQNFTIDVSSPVLITGNQGTTIQFYANSFEDAAGNSITGNVDIELIEIYEKKDMLFLNKQTLGDNNGNLSPLISGGEFKITASKGGNEVYLKQGTAYNATVQAPNGTDPNMGIFYQNSVTDDTLTWTADEDTFTNFVFLGDGFYDVYFRSLGWVNCDYFMNQPGNQTSVSVNVPNGFNNTNCSIFISFDGYNSLVSIYNYSNDNFYTGNNYTLPEGLAVHFIALAFINNIPHAAIIPATITTNHSEVISALTATTQSQLDTDIQNLP